jgi:hypothetical protein
VYIFDCRLYLINIKLVPCALVLHILETLPLCLVQLLISIMAISELVKLSSKLLVLLFHEVSEIIAVTLVLNRNVLGQLLKIIDIFPQLVFTDLKYISIINYSNQLFFMNPNMLSNI